MKLSRRRMSKLELPSLSHLSHLSSFFLRRRTLAAAPPAPPLLILLHLSEIQSRELRNTVEKIWEIQMRKFEKYSYFASLSALSSDLIKWGETFILGHFIVLLCWHSAQRMWILSFQQEIWYFFWLKMILIENLQSTGSFFVLNGKLYVCRNQNVKTSVGWCESIKLPIGKP